MSRSVLARAGAAALRAVIHGGPRGRDRLRSRLRGTLTVLVYHRIAEREEEPWLEAGGVPRTSPRAFEAQLREMTTLGGQFFTIEDVARGERPDPDRAGFVVTFDDGFKDNFERARDTLDRVGVHATFFVTTELPARTRLLWEHRLCWAADRPPALDRLRARLSERTGGRREGSAGRAEVLRTVRTLLLPAEAESLLDEVLAPEAASLPPPDALYATWSQIGAAAEAGHQIGGHTASHRMRHVLDQRGYREELRRSQRALVEHLGRRSSAMSHPFNSYFVGEEGLCAEEGFEQLATVDGGRVLKGTPAHCLPRRTVFGIHDSRLRFRELLAEGSPWS